MPDTPVGAKDVGLEKQKPSLSESYSGAHVHRKKALKRLFKLIMVTQRIEIIADLFFFFFTFCVVYNICIWEKIDSLKEGSCGCMPL